MLTLGFSPCPNDTFVFHALVHGLVPDAPDFAPPTYADVDVLNTLALDGALDVVKVSYGVLPLLRGYTLLRSGGALGRGCGPLVVTRGRNDLRGATIAVPGERTTAYLLLRLWNPGYRNVTVLPFDQIMPAVAAGQVDAGLVIHEARFTYQQYGLTAAADLGQWWEQETQLPIPLGAIVAKDTLDTKAIDQAIRTSVEMAWADPNASRAYVLAHSQELQPDVVDAHIALYVNDYTRDIGDEGGRAIKELVTRANGLAGGSASAT